MLLTRSMTESVVLLVGTVAPRASAMVVIGEVVLAGENLLPTCAISETELVISMQRIHCLP